MGSRVLTAENLNLEFHRDRLIWKALVHYGLHHRDSAKALGITEKGLQLINVRQTEIASVCKTAIEMNKTSRLVTTLKAEAFGIKSVAYKTPNNLWVTKVLESKPISKSFHYNDSNFDGNETRRK